MNLEKLSKKFVGSEDERAVSPVIGVILMVAITVILAAVIAAFVLDLGDSVDNEAQAGVDVDQSQTDDTVTVSLTSEGNTEYVIVRGDVPEDNNMQIVGTDGSDLVSGTIDLESSDGYVPGNHEEVQMADVGDSVTFDYSDDDIDGDDAEGTLTVVGVTEDGTETSLTSSDFDFQD